MQSLYALLLITVLISACGHQPDLQTAKPISDGGCALSTVHRFLKWYGKEHDALDSIQIFTTDLSTDSARNILHEDQIPRYLQALRTSGFFTEKFLADKKAWFRKKDYDVDYLLFSTNTEDILNDTLNPNIQQTDTTTTFDKYLVFTVSKTGGTCRIDSIRFITNPDSAADAVIVPGADSTDPTIYEIKREYEKIRADSSLRVVTKDLDGESTEGGDDTLFYQRNELRKASVALFGETGRMKIEYYFAHGRLFFSIAQETRYTKSFYLSDYRVAFVKTTRCYLHNGHLIRYIDERGKLVDKGLYPAKEKELLVDDSSFFSTFKP